MQPSTGCGFRGYGKDRLQIMTTEGQTTDFNTIEKLLCRRSHLLDVGACAYGSCAPLQCSQPRATMVIPWSHRSHAGASAMWLGATIGPDST